MCVLAFALDWDARWPLVLLANRDERHDRPSAPLHRWADAPSILGGRDLDGGGTWLGVSEAGRLAAITNVRTPEGPQPGRPTRGALVRDLLTDDLRPALGDLAGYNLFNLLRLEFGRAALWTNAPHARHTERGAGIHSLSNGVLAEKAGRALRLEQALRAGLSSLSTASALLDLLHDETSLDGGAPIFMRNSSYGTRCSTLVRVAGDGRGEILERRFDAEARVCGETREIFTWPRRSDR